MLRQGIKDVIIKAVIKMIKIMFVCHGNICRSPMAEIIFKDMVKKQGVEGEFLISSSATSTEEIWNGVGNPVYEPARRELERHGIACPHRQAVQVKKSDYDEYDMLIAMDQRNISNLSRMLGADKDGKVHKLMEFAGGGDVADPWYYGNFDKCFDDIYKGCEGLLEYLKRRGEI